MSSPTPAASVLLTRGPDAAEVLLVRRAEQLRFFGGFWAFPGGKSAPDDAEFPGIPARAVTAARELFEETGIVLARTADGSFPPSAARFNDARRAMMDDKLTFTAFLTEFGLHLRADDFTCMGEITTPKFAPMRFATTFFVAALPPGQTVEIWPGELDESAWETPAGMLQRWRRGEVLLSPPSTMTLQSIEGRSVGEAPARLAPILSKLADGAMHPIYFAPAVQMLPLRAASLMPITHTNAFFVGCGPRYLIDPGASDADEQQRLFEILDAHQAAGRSLSAVVLTHHHSDHMGAAGACAQRYRVPIWASEVTAQELRGELPVDRLLAEGDRLDLGPRPDGSGPWYLEALHTPGHAWGHFCFYDPFYRLLLAGDMVSTLTSVVIAPPEGDLTVYLQSLRRLIDLPLRLLLPAHGNPSARPRHTLEAALTHRMEREQQLVEMLRQGMGTADEIGPEMYRGLPAQVMPFALLQIEAGLEKLRREGRAERVDATRWALTR